GKKQCRKPSTEARGRATAKDEAIPVMDEAYDGAKTPMAMDEAGRMAKDDANTRAERPLTEAIKSPRRRGRAATTKSARSKKPSYVEAN
ncbi:MAG: hypothetical protein M1835_006933, partial [Candelina submexicana]